jgi:hypothetical protein
VIPFVSTPRPYSCGKWLNPFLFDTETTSQRKDEFSDTLTSSSSKAMEDIFYVVNRDGNDKDGEVEYTS